MTYTVGKNKHKKKTLLKETNLKMRSWLPKSVGIWTQDSITSKSPYESLLTCLQSKGIYCRIVYVTVTIIRVPSSVFFLNRWLKCVKVIKPTLEIYREVENALTSQTYIAHVAQNRSKHIWLHLIFVEHIMTLKKD